MKTVYSILATLALLFSLPALASGLAEKSMEKAADKAPKETKEATAKDHVAVEKGSMKEKPSPICFGGG